MLNKIKDERPWGNFEQFVHNKQCTVKLLNVNPNAQLSLQFHHKREEFWRVVEGEGFVLIGEEEHSAKKGDEFFIPTGAKHRIRTEGSALTIMEISLGEFDEDDIVRLEDKYGRVAG